MTRLPTLTTALLDLLREVEDVELPLIVGGGFGVYLRHQQIAENGRQTMLLELPEPSDVGDRMG